MADPATDLQGHRLAAEALKTTRIHGAACLTGARTAVVTTRPCRAPHQTNSDVGLIGGGHVPNGDSSFRQALDGACMSANLLYVPIKLIVATWATLILRLHALDSWPSSKSRFSEIPSYRLPAPSYS